MSSKALFVFVSTLALGLGPAAHAADANAPWQGAGTEVIEAPPADALGDAGLDHISVLRIDGWRPVGRDAIILWPTPFEAYLLKLDRPAVDLPFVERVGLTQTGNQLYARFDSVIVRGRPYRIASIHPISREAARTLRSAADVG
jgi:hypothetical protein